MMSDLLETIDDGVAVLTLNRPDRLNALSDDMVRQLCAALTRLGTDPAVGCIVLTGAGRGFCAGGDVKRMADASEVTMEERQEALRWKHESVRLAAHDRQGGDRRGEWPRGRRRAGTGARLRPAYRCPVGQIPHRLRRCRIFRRFRRIVVADPIGWDRQGAGDVLSE